MNRSLTIRVPDELRAAIQASADAQQRSLANFLLWHLTTHFAPAQKKPYMFTSSEMNPETGETP